MCVHAASYLHASGGQKAYWCRSKCRCGGFYLQNHIYVCVCIRMSVTSMHLSINFLWALPHKQTYTYSYEEIYLENACSCVQQPLTVWQLQQLSQASNCTILLASPLLLTPSLATCHNHFISNMYGTHTHVSSPKHVVVCVCVCVCAQKSKKCAPEMHFWLQFHAIEKEANYI